MITLTAVTGNVVWELMLNVVGFVACLVLVLGFALSRPVHPERPVHADAELAAAALDVVLAQMAADRTELDACARAAGGDRGSDRVEAVPNEPARPEVRTDLVGGPDHQPFRIYARGERRPFDLGGDEPVVFGALRWSPIDAAGNVTLTAEGLRDLCNHVYQDGWRFGNMAPRAPVAADLQNLQHIRRAINRTAYHGGLGLRESGRYLATMDRLLASFGVRPDDHGDDGLCGRPVNDGTCILPRGHVGWPNDAGCSRWSDAR